MLGQTVSHYKIIEKLGEGGMGVVYKAQDTKLDRMVALKFLPSHLSASVTDKERFIQEARAASALNHPNVCTIHDIQEHESDMFIVMEFVDGRTLGEIKGTVNHKQAVDIGTQIAEGLAAAHEKGIIHRDIKPENIMVRKDGIVQIMDFGLAKLRGISRLTKEGSTVGTAGYMSPEQVQGQATDHRSDIFSLGIVLYEMFAGQLPFKGLHETAMAYEIVNVDSTPMSSIKPEIPPELDAIVLECLEKDPKERTQSASQVAVDLKRYRRESGRQRASRITAARPVALSPSASRTGEIPDQDPRGKRPPSFIMTGVIAVAAAIAGFGISYFAGHSSTALPVVRASVEMPAGVTYRDAFGGHSAVSPDGSMVVFAAADSHSQVTLWTRQLSTGETRSLAGTGNATYPFWSPDGKSIGFFAEGKVKTIDAGGGPVLSLAGAPFGRGGAWSSRGEILFSPSVSDPNLYAVSVSGGAARAVTAFDSTTKSAPRFPFFLPDGNHFVFSMLDLGPSNISDAWVGSLDNPESMEILKGVSHPFFVSGYLFFLRQGILMTQQFDPGSFAFSGSPVQLQGQINMWGARAKADYSVSWNGVLVYSSGAGGREAEFFWTTHDGIETPIVQTESSSLPVLSPDGTAIAFDVIDDQGGKSNIWVYDLRSKSKMRLTFSEQAVSRSVWSRSGSVIYYNIEVGGSKANISFKRADGSGDEEILVRGEEGAPVGYFPSDISPDGRFLLLEESNESKNELAVVDLMGTEKPRSVRKLGIAGRRGRFSPDGQWIVYQSNESGIERIYVSSFGGRAGKWQLSPEGGNTPYWQRDKIIYYSSSANRFEGVGVSFSSGTPSFSRSTMLFPAGKNQNTLISGVSPDGKKYLGARPLNAGSTGRLSVIVNWQGLLKSN